MSDMTRRNAATKALITGGAQGVGLSVARQLIAEGCTGLVLLGRSAEKGKAAVAELEEFLGKSIRFQADEQYLQEQFDVVLL